jgi:DNA-binding CsgD family transcriptional regulator
MPDTQSDLIVTERAGRVAWRLAKGAKMTTCEVAKREEIHIRSAYHLMNKLARVLPIRLDEYGYWAEIPQTCDQ